MAREVKEHDERLNEILNSARKFFFTAGYDSTSISTIINDIGIAKGTFYHYFNSKQDLLMQVVERITDEVLEVVRPLLSDDSLNAFQKFERFFTDAGNWKLENKEQLLELMRIIYRDENIVLLHRMNERSIEKTSPLLAEVISHGRDEGHFNTAYPNEAAEIIMYMGVGLATQLRTIILEGRRDKVSLEYANLKVSAYERAVERILGAPDGSLTLIDVDFVDKFAEAAEAGK